MENISVFNKLKNEFKKYVNQDNQINDVDAQKASWEFGIYPSTSQIFEIHTCHGGTGCSHNLDFHEYCLLIALIESEKDKAIHKSKIKKLANLNDINFNYDVFLGGACNPTTWRRDVAIPFLKEKQITFYNPQVLQWDPSLIATEARAKEACRVQLFVLDVYKTRGIASLVEVAYLSGLGCNLILVVLKDIPERINDKFEVKDLDDNEFQSINRSYLLIVDLVQRQCIPIFSNVDDALGAIKTCLTLNCSIQELTDMDKVVPVQHGYVNVSQYIHSVKKAFEDLDLSKSGVITINDVKSGLCKLFDCDVNLISQTKSSFTFSEFCIEYSILLLNSCLQNQAAPRSQSADFVLQRNNSNDDKLHAIKSDVNIKSNAHTHEETLQNFYETKKKSLFTCFSNKGKLMSCIFSMMKYPFSTISESTENKTSNKPNTSASVRLAPKLSTDEEYYDIFLGGTCGNSDWRKNVAIPLITEACCTFYDPQIRKSEWTRSMLPIEANAREHSKILVYVITKEGTSTTALVEAAHFIGQQKNVVLYIELLLSLYSPPLIMSNDVLQSSCTFPSTSSNNARAFFNLQEQESTTSDYHSISTNSMSETTTTFNNYSLSPISKKQSTSDFGHLNSNEDIENLRMSINNISMINHLSPLARNEHNRGRKYLIDLAHTNHVPILSSVEETICVAIKLCRESSSFPKFADR